MSENEAETPPERHGEGGNEERGVDYPQRVKEILKSPEQLSISIAEAAKCHDVHSQLQSYIVYSIIVGPLLVKRRYSEFESLRSCLIKLFPTTIIPPIPEKQSLSSNIATTTSNSLRISSGKITGAHSPPSMDEGASDQKPATLGESSKAVKLVEYRKRMLRVFLNRCLKITKICESSYFQYFLDPQTNFHDFLNSKENIVFYKSSIYQLSPFDPMGEIHNQLYLTLPIPSSSDSHLFKEVSEDEQFEMFINYETKFLKYEFVLGNISKINKHLLKHFTELSGEMSDLGSNFNKLSLLQDSTSIENIGKAFERRNLYLNGLCDSINYEFLDKLIEMKNFSTTVKEMIEYNRKKIIQHKMVERDLFAARARAQRFEAEEKRIRKIDVQTSQVLGENVDDSLDAPITDNELQAALFARSKKSLYDNIPGMSKINSMILKYVNDPNPDETRRTKYYNVKLRLFQLQRQYEILTRELDGINEGVMKELVDFHDWFREMLNGITTNYDASLKTFVTNCKTSWDEVN